MSAAVCSKKWYALLCALHTACRHGQLVGRRRWQLVQAYARCCSAPVLHRNQRGSVSQHRFRHEHREAQGEEQRVPVEQLARVVAFTVGGGARGEAQAAEEENPGGHCQQHGSLQRPGEMLDRWWSWGAQPEGHDGGLCARRHSSAACRTLLANQGAGLGAHWFRGVVSGLLSSACRCTAASQALRPHSFTPMPPRHLIVELAIRAGHKSKRSGQISQDQRGAHSSRSHHGSVLSQSAEGCPNSAAGLQSWHAMIGPSRCSALMGTCFRCAVLAGCALHRQPGGRPGLGAVITSW